ncbi:PolC-type DNA polymerase III [uncultured Bifidobacterium sp.]|uniref:3'-5' exonuclease n=1 Tax=uncultured Bifidobacterium sp. TaxID=165187 RepID=UPI00258460E0|nr:3'-5' exonuclease [uncultured Bifidobacterium sp.]
MSGIHAAHRHGRHASAHDLSAADPIEQLWSFVAAAGNADAIVFDTETTGIGNNARIIEIGALLIGDDNTPIYEYDQLIQPHAKLSAGITELTGITDSDLADQPDAGFVIPQFLTAIRPLLLIGHNVSFDIRMLNIEGGLLGCREVSNDYLDTMTISHRMFPNAPSRSLQEVMRLLGINEIEEHRAISDARQTWQCFQQLKHMNHPVVLSDDEAEQSRRRHAATKRRRTNAYMRSSYLSNRDTTPVNAKPDGMVIDQMVCGVTISGDTAHQDVLSRYGYDAWLWVTVSHGIIESGKNAGHPTLCVALDGVEIGRIPALQEERHRGQIPPQGAVMVAHIPNTKADRESGIYRLRLQMPAENDRED